MKRKLTLIFILTLIINVNIVKADTCDAVFKGLASGENEFETRGKINMHYTTQAGGNGNFDFHFFNFVGEDSKNYQGFCRNAGTNPHTQGNTYSHTSTQEFCANLMFDQSSDENSSASLETKAYQKGIIDILTTDLSDLYKIDALRGVSIDENLLYIFKNVALRTYELYWKNQNSNNKDSNTTHNLYKSMEYYANLWLTNEGEYNLSDELNELEKKLNEVGQTGAIKRTFNNRLPYVWWEYKGNTVTDIITSGSYELLKIAINGSIEYLETGTVSITWNENPIKSPTEISGNTKKYKLTHTFDIKNFNVENKGADSSFITAKFTCKNCKEYNLVPEIYIDGEKYTAQAALIGNEYVQDIYLLEILKNKNNSGTGEIKLDIVFVSNSDTYKCEKINYDIQLFYKDTSIGTEAYEAKDSDCAKLGKKCQNFYILASENKEWQDKIEYSGALCEQTCKQVEEQCNDLTNPNRESACQIYEDTYGGDCKECTTHINNHECTEEDSEVSLEEGYKVDTSNCNDIKDESNLDVLNCILDEEDPAGNSYQATTENFSNVQDDNPYCQVYCKEEYHFQLPGIKEANSGRYFQLEASINGAKTCYTTKIDKEQFEKDLEKAAKEVIKHYNFYIFEYHAENTIWTDTDLSVTTYDYYKNIGDLVCQYDSTGTHPMSGAIKDFRYIECSYEKGSCYIKRFKKKFGTTYNGEVNKVIPNDNDNYSKNNLGAWDCIFGDNSRIKGTLYDYNQHFRYWSKYYLHPNGNGDDIQGIDSQKEKAVLNQKIKEYIRILNQYNKCGGHEVYEYDSSLKSSKVTGWEMDYTYDPNIKFWYEESYMNNVLTDELDANGEIKLSGLTEVFYQNDNEKIPTNPMTINENWGPRRYFTCKVQSGHRLSGVNSAGYNCGWHYINTVGASYVSQEMTSEGKYITPTQFYTIHPSGTIVAKEEGKEIENGTVQQNVLPVGLGTPQGVYNYVLKVENLGEYYDKGSESTKEDKLGRLWGDSDSVVVEVLDKKEEGETCIEEGAITSEDADINTSLEKGAYVCAYRVNCPDCPVECDPECKNKNCPEGNCPIECENCLYTNSSTNINYRPITPSDINPTDRVLGPNWYYPGSEKEGNSIERPATSINTALQLKAYVTTKEIEQEGETIYNVDYENPEKESNPDYAVSITLDAGTIERIKEYNKEQENNGGYLNDTMKCYNHKGEDEKTYKNVYCYSTFIDEIFYPNGEAKNIKILGDKRLLKEAERRGKTQGSGYWTSWDEATWEVTTNFKIDYKTSGIGPSWK